MKYFSFNGITKDYVKALTGSNRPAWAPIERTFFETHKGSLMGKQRIVNPREISLPILIKAENLTDLQKVKEDLAAWLIHDEAKPLIFNDEPDRVYYAAVEGSFDPEEIVYLGHGIIPFICPDPFKYGHEVNVSLGANTVFNEGSLPTNPVFTIRFTSNSTNYTLTANNKTIKIIWNFKTNDILTIDTSKRKVIINNLVKMTAIDLKSNWPELLPGQNTITADRYSATINIKFRPKWH